MKKIGVFIDWNKNLEQFQIWYLVVLQRVKHLKR